MTNLWETGFKKALSRYIEQMTNYTGVTVTGWDDSASEEYSGCSTCGGWTTYEVELYFTHDDSKPYARGLAKGQVMPSTYIYDGHFSELLYYILENDA